MRQYRDGAVFVRAVIDQVGRDGFNAVWSSPETLPAGRRDRRAERLGAPGPRLSDARSGVDVRSRPRGRRHPPRGARAPGRPARRAAVVLVACCGGPDSLALAGALAFEAPARGGSRRRGSSSTTRLQEGPPQVAEAAAALCREMGLDPVEVVRAERAHERRRPRSRRRAVGALRRAGAARRAARCRPVLIGHTRDDQAEQVLLGLARGSGSRSLAGMPRRRGLFVRPLIALPRGRDRGRLRRLRDRAVARPAQRGPDVRAGPGPRVPARPRGRAGPGYRRGARPQRGDAARGRGLPREPGDEAPRVLPSRPDGDVVGHARSRRCPGRCAPGSGGCSRSRPGAPPPTLSRRPRGVAGRAADVMARSGPAPRAGRHAVARTGGPPSARCASRKPDRRRVGPRSACG